MWRALPILTVIVLLAALCPPAECAGDKTLGIDWPRQRVAEDGTVVTVHRPQVDSWKMYVSLRFHAVVGMLAPEDTVEVLGTIVGSADTETDFGTRIVAIYNLQLEETNFPSMSEEESRAAERIIREILSRSIVGGS